MRAALSSLITRWASWSLGHWKYGLILGFSTLLLLIGFVSTIGLQTLDDTDQRLKAIVATQLQKLILTKTMHAAARERTVILAKLIYLEDPFDRDEEILRFQQMAVDFGVARRQLIDLRLSPFEANLVEEQGQRTRKALPLQERVIELSAAGQLAQAQAILVQEAIPAQTAVLDVLAELDNYTREQVEAAMQNASLANDKARRLITYLSASALGVGLLVALVVAYLTMRAGIEKEHLATHDTLTGLPNRMLLLDRLAQALAQARRDKTLIGVLFIDLDRFKVINDTLGHAAGDELIRAMAGRLRKAVRDTDVVARLSGDEFIVLVQKAATNSSCWCRRPAGPSMSCRWWRRSWMPCSSPTTSLAARSSPPAASASASIPMTATNPTTCSSMPTRRCTTPRKRAETASACSMQACTSRRPSAWNWRLTCAMPWKTTNWRCSTSPNSTPGVAASWPWRHCCAGTTRVAAY